jgi:uridine phosphorylase
MNEAALNNQLEGLAVDYLYHLGLSSADDLKGMFGDVKHVAMMGSADRAYAFALKLNKELHDLDPTTIQPIGKTERFSMYKVGDTISVSHGMGQPSHSILLHEITKMLHYAGAENFTYYRLGTSGGLGVEPGTVVIADKGLHPSGRAEYTLHVLGEPVTFETDFDIGLAHEILSVRGDIEAVIGSTVAGDDFYTEQARLDGAFRLIDQAQKMRYLRSLHDLGALNFEMESAGFAAFCKQLGIPAACMCVTLLNRLEGDQVTSTPEQLAAFSDRPQQLLINHIRETRKRREIQAISTDVSGYPGLGRE